MRKTLTISVPERTRRKVQRAARQRGLTASEYVRRALERQFFIEAFESARAELVPQARALGIFTDEDVFNHFRS